ncbi:MAG TPA: hypothetical protein PKY87_08905 [Terricaulis sp.]|nr:hypothetical protein [Terricaulis sp.]
MKNKISDLNNHLFAQLERLGDEDLTSEQIERECQRAEAICAVSEQLIRSATVSLKAAELIANNGGEANMRIRAGGALTPLIEGTPEKSQ